MAATSGTFSAFGVDEATFISYFTEGLELMKAAWSDEPTVTFHGRFRDVDGLPIQPKPVQRPHPPIWLGGSAPKAIARAVRLGDAFLGAGSSTTASFVEAVKTVRARTRQAGQGPGSAIHHRQTGLPDGRRRRRPRPRTGARRTAPHLRRDAGHRRGSGVGHAQRRGSRACARSSTPAPRWSCSTRSASTSPRIASRWNGLLQT